MDNPSSSYDSPKLNEEMVRTVQTFDALNKEFTVLLKAADSVIAENEDIDHPVFPS